MEGLILEFDKSPTPCRWHLGTTEPSPHIHRPAPPKKLIYNDILEAVGNTPMVRINNITREEGIQCEILAKCEFLNPGGSVKDRIGVRMLIDAEEQGLIRPGFNLVEATSGNTGIGLAMACASKGYKLHVTLPEKMSQEKVDTLKALGANVIRTPTEAAFNAPESHLGIAVRLLQELPNCYFPNQYSNPANPLAHYDGTADEIIEQTGGRLDYLVISAGTGGTIAGIARKFKEKLPHVQIIGVDPHGSILALPEELNGPISTYAVEGIGYDFVPRVLDRSCIDSWVKSDDKTSLLMARRLIKQEGLLVGGSSGTAMHAAIELARTLPADKRVVVLLPDNIRNYITKFINDDWMIQLGFIDPPPVLDESTPRVRDLTLVPAVTVTPSTLCQDAVDAMVGLGIDQIPVTEDGKVVGVVTTGAITARLGSGRTRMSDPCSSVMFKSVRIVAPDFPLTHLSSYFEKNHFAIVQFPEHISVVSAIDLAKHYREQARS
jgi:cystathionine beta-synthase